MKMRSHFMSSVLVGAMLAASFGGAVMAAGRTASIHDTDTSTIKSISGLFVTLTDGQSYTLPYGTNMSKFHVGETVAVAWESTSSTNGRSAISISAS